MLNSWEIRAVKFDRRLIPYLAPQIFFLLFLAPAVQAADLSEAETLFKSGKYDECITITAKAIEDNAFSEHWRILKIQCELETGKYEDALKTLQVALDRYSHSIKLRWLGRDVYRYNKMETQAAQAVAEIVQRVRVSEWRYRDAGSVLVLAELLLENGADAKDVRKEFYTRLQESQPSLVESYLASGKLALHKHDYRLAAIDFEKAIKVDDKHPAACLGLAEAYANSDGEKSSLFLNRALELNSQYVPALLYQVDNAIDAEDYTRAKSLIDAVRKVNAINQKASAYLAVISHLEGKYDEEQQHRKQALSTWEKNPAIDSLIGRKLSQKYRFAEGAEYQKKALAFDPNYLPAKVQLSSDLLRLGREEEGWKLAEEVFDRDNYNVVAYNLTTLRDEIKTYRVLSADGFRVRMEETEAAIYGQRVLNLLRDAKQVLAAKYDVELEEPIFVEIFPRQQDFAIRTFGLPGGAGFLGVCFGRVITMNSPASQGNAPSNWESVLWHEFCHVITLSKTNNRMPRWLSEGISVYEERQQNKAWGQSMTPTYRKMILGDDLTPVSQLSAAFLRPPSSQHLMFAYYESSMVVEYLIAEYGSDALNGILNELAKGVAFNDAVGRHAVSIVKLDSEFDKYIKAKANAFGSKVDLASDALPKPNESEAWEAFIKENPNNFWAMQFAARSKVAEKNWPEAIAAYKKMIELFPEYTGEGNSYDMLTRIYRETKKPELELEVLEQLAAMQADDQQVFSRLIELNEQKNNWEAVAENANRMLAVNPLIPAPHRSLAKAAREIGETPLAIDSLRALTMMEPFDPAGLHFELATLLHQSGRIEEARLEVLLALEEAPRYRDAQQLLLKIVREHGTLEEVQRREKLTSTPPAPALPEDI